MSVMSSQTGPVRAFRTIKLMTILRRRVLQSSHPENKHEMRITENVSPEIDTGGERRLQSAHIIPIEIGKRVRINQEIPPDSHPDERNIPHHSCPLPPGL